MRTVTFLLLTAMLVTAPAISAPEDERPTVADLLVKAKSLYDEKRYEEEREAYRAAIRIDPDCSTAHGRLAMSNYTSAGGSIVTVVGAGKPLDAAEIFEKAADGDVPEVYRTVLYTRAGNLRRKGGDRAGARRDYTEALGHPKCRSTIDACIGLAILDVEDGNPEMALDNLAVAVSEGSGACRKIAALREGELAPLFMAQTSERSA